MMGRTTRGKNGDLGQSIPNINTTELKDSEKKNKNHEIKDKVSKPKSKRNRMTLSCSVCRKRKIKVCIFKIAIENITFLLPLQ